MTSCGVCGAAMALVVQAHAPLVTEGTKPQTLNPKHTKL